MNLFEKLKVSTSTIASIEMTLHASSPINVGHFYTCYSYRLLSIFQTYYSHIVQLSYRFCIIIFVDARIFYHHEFNARFAHQQ